MASIENQEALTRIFGDWPSFHDAEVLSLLLDRHGFEDRPGPTLEAKIHLFQMTGEVDERGYFRLRNHTLVVLRFFQVDGLKLEGFNHQNVLRELSIEDISSRQMEDIKFKVHFSSAFGLEASFLCRAVAVVSTEPFVPAPHPPDGRGIRGGARPCSW